MTQLEIILGSLVVVFAVLTVAGFSLARQYYQRWRTRQSNAFNIGARQVKGDVLQLLGTFAVLEDYEQLITLSTTSQQGSLDLIGVKANAVDFIEFKKKGAALHGPERKIRRLVQEGKVNYVVKDVDLPDTFTMQDRPTNVARPFGDGHQDDARPK